MNAIEVEHLTKTYGPARGIKDISFSVRQGEVMGFLGPNGSGKTTTMRILTCFFPPTSGTARISGHDILKNPMEVRRRMGYLPESVPLYLDMPAIAYLRFFAEIKGVPARRRRAKVDEVIQQCGLDSVAHRLIHKLSKGYRQRVGIAQALLNDPEVLILDEPTVGLDPRQIIDIRNLIKGLGGNRTVILSTHILPEVSMTCDRVIIIHEGRLIAVDTPRNLTKRLQQTPQLTIKTDGPPETVCTCLESIDGVRSVIQQNNNETAAAEYLVETDDQTGITNAIARTICDKNWNLQEIRPADMSLEEIFIKLVNEEEGAQAR
ncbi:MAG: ABC transporter ATP-binding protein [Deltaproteobacteria bacterium]|nr:ABC transporter ATP-binding protein [Deltaproteobacteria bacterium]